jgi:putative acetyltransferase
MAHLRRELPTDVEAVRDVHDRAFGQPHEGRLVDSLRSSAARRVSIVAEVDGRIMGHIYFSPVTVECSAARLEGMGLAPLAVLPEFQRQGIGSQLVQRGLEECRQLGERFAVVLGHSEYYPRFGFVPAATMNLSCEYPVTPEAFMVLELRAGALDGCRGLVKYGPEFAGL